MEIYKKFAYKSQMCNSNKQSKQQTKTCKLTEAFAVTLHLRALTFFKEYCSWLSNQIYKRSINEITIKPLLLSNMMFNTITNALQVEGMFQFHISMLIFGQTLTTL